MKKLILALALFVGLSTSAVAQGTYHSEGDIVEGLKATVAAYAGQDWDTYRAAFASDAQFYPSSTEAISLDDRVAEHQQAHELFSNIHFMEPVYGAIENDGQTWGMIWGTWMATSKATGEQVSVPVHVAIQFQDGKGILEYGFWDTAPLQAAAEAAMGN